MNTTQAKLQNKHYPCGGYLHIKTPERSLVVPLHDIDKTKDGLQQRIDRLRGQIDVLNLYLEGKTVLDPDALR